MSLVEIAEVDPDFNEDSYFGNKDIIEIVYKNNHEQFLEFLKESGPVTDLNVLAKQGLSLAHISASNDCIRTLAELVARGIDLHHIDDNCETVLHAASKKATKDVISFLIEKKVELNFQNKKGDTPLHCAVAEGNLIAVDILSREPNCKVNLRNKNGETPLCLGVIKGKVDVVKCLLACRIDMNAEDKNGYTPLHHAICRHQTTIALMLVNSGAHVNQPDLDRNTPLHLATKEDLLPVVQALCAYGCKVDCYNNDGFTALQVGARLGLLDVVRCLLLAGASPFIPSKDNVYPDIMAYARGHKKTGALLHMMTPERRAVCIEQLVPSTRPISKIKLKIFGSSMSGKTSLINSLRSGYIRGMLSTKLRSLDIFNTSENNLIGLREKILTNELKYELDHEDYTRGIDIVSANISGVGDFCIWEFSGYEPYYSMYDHFIGDTTCIHLIIISMLDNLDVIKQRMRFWLEFIGSRIPSREPLEFCGKAHFMAKVLIAATHANSIGGERNDDGLLENIQVVNIFNNIKADFQFNLEIYDQIVFVDSTDKVSPEMKQLKSVLLQMRTVLTEKLPATNGLANTVANKIHEIIPKQEFPVLSWQQFVDRVRSKVNPLCNEDHLKDLIQQLQYMGEAIYLETESEPDMIILTPNWLCSDVLGFLLSFENISSSRVTGSFTADEVQLMLGVDNTDNFLRILTSIDLCSECVTEDEVQYEFPCLNFVDAHDHIWSNDDSCDISYRYIGIQFHTSPLQFIHLFPRIQIQIRRSICEDSPDVPKAELDQWFHGSLLTCQENNVQIILTLENSNQIIEVKGRAQSSTDDIVVMYGFFQDIINVIHQTIDEVCPNLEYELFCIENLNEITYESRQFDLYSQGEIIRHMLDCEGEIDGLDLNIKNMLFLNNEVILNQIKLGPNLHVSSLRLPTMRKLCHLLDPTDPMGRDWCLLALRLGLDNDVPRLDGKNENTQSRTGAVLSIWGTKNMEVAIIKNLISVFKNMDRLDAAFLLSTCSPLYQFIPITTGSDFETIC